MVTVSDDNDGVRMYACTHVGVGGLTCTVRMCIGLRMSRNQCMRMCVNLCISYVYVCMNVILCCAILRDSVLVHERLCEFCYLPPLSLQAGS